LFSIFTYYNIIIIIYLRIMYLRIVLLYLIVTMRRDFVINFLFNKIIYLLMRISLVCDFVRYYNFAVLLLQLILSLSLSLSFSEFPALFFVHRFCYRGEGVLFHTTCYIMHKSTYSYAISSLRTFALVRARATAYVQI